MQTPSSSSGQISFGLADLVVNCVDAFGRAEHKAYAYLLLPACNDEQSGGAQADQRHQQYSSLGAGFSRRYARDLEIAARQHPGQQLRADHVMARRFRFCIAVAQEAWAQLKGEKAQLRLDVDLRLRFCREN